MRSHALLGWVCAFLAFASTVTSQQPPYPVLTPSEVYAYWVDTGDVWGIDECNPLPRDIHEILSCTGGEGFSGVYVERSRQDISGRFSVSNAIGWMAGYPMVCDGQEIQPLPSFDDFLLYYPSEASRIQAVLPTMNLNSVSWSTNDAPPFRFLRSESIPGAAASISFTWSSCPVVTRVYFGVNYAPRWWADGLHIGVVDLASYKYIFPDVDLPPTPWIEVPSTFLEDVFTNSMHFTFREVWK